MFLEVEVAMYNETRECPRRFDCCEFMMFDCCGHDCWEPSLEHPDQDDPDFIG